MPSRHTTEPVLPRRAVGGLAGRASGQILEGRPALALRGAVKQSPETPAARQQQRLQVGIGGDRGDGRRSRNLFRDAWAGSSSSRWMRMPSLTSDRPAFQCDRAGCRWPGGPRPPRRVGRRSGRVPVWRRRRRASWEESQIMSTRRKKTGVHRSLVLALGTSQFEKGSHRPRNLVGAAWLEVNLSAPVAHPCSHAGDLHLDAFFLKFLSDRSSSESAPAFRTR